MDRLRFRADYQPFRTDTGTLIVAGEGRHLVIDDVVVAEVAELLDGVRTVPEIIGQLADRHALPVVFKAISRLQALRVLTEATSGELGTGVTAAWDARGVVPNEAASWQRTAGVVVLDLGTPTIGALVETLRTSGIQVETVDWADEGMIPDLTDLTDLIERLSAASPAPLLVAAVGSLLDPRLAQVNAAVLEHGLGLTLVRPHGTSVLVGPHLVPGETGCWECLRQRVAANEQLESYLQDVRPDLGRVDVARAALPAGAAVAGGVLATELPVIATASMSPRLTGRMLSVDLLEYGTETHELTRQPQCSGCGDPNLVLKADPRITLSSQAMSFSDDGGHRVRTPQDTFDRLDRHVSPLLGVVTGIAPLDDYDNGVTFSYGAGHNFAMGTTSVVQLRKNLRGQSGGKGRTEIQAKVSAICEGIERYSGVWRDDRPVHTASYAQLGPERAVHPRDLLLFSEQQYANRESWNAERGHGLHFVPHELPDTEPMAWTTGWSLSNQRPRELPAGYVWFGHPDGRRLRYCAADANGCASGNTLEEAILQGFCELVERDSIALWWYHRSRVPGFDLDTIRDPWLDQVREFYDTELRRSLWVLDVTADLGIPCYVAVSHRLDAEIQDPLVGFGAHLDPQVALRRALTEVNQFLPTLVERNPDGSTRYGLNDPESLEWFTTARIEEQTWLLPDPDVAPTTFATYGDSSTGDIATDVQHCVALADRAGLDVIAMDQSRPELELPVARVLVPGLRHFWRRLAPGRLYDVPARLGRTPRVTDEADINSYSVFF